ncbi:hypothetical protein JCM5353_004067 [Sporobolomyces roseus]
MASLNWAILDSSNRPVPLPQEKSLLHLSSVSLSLFPSHPGQSTNSKPLPTDTHYTAEKGHVYLSNQRVVYVAPSNSTSGEPRSSSLETLSVPYTHFRDGHLHQPWLGANYYQAICIPAREGGLSCPHVIRLTFKEGGGFDFYSTVLEMRERLGNRATQTGEDLPLYTPPNPSSSNSNSTSTPPAPSRTQSSSSQPSPRPPPAQARTMPSQSDLNAANVAREAELEEETQRQALVTGLASQGRGGGERSAPPPIGDDLPPGYTA